MLDEWTQEQIDRMTVGGNAKALVFFRSHGVPDDARGEAKYKTKAAEQYKQHITQEVQNVKDQTDDITVSSSMPTTPVQPQSTVVTFQSESKIPTYTSSNLSNDGEKDIQSSRASLFARFDEDFEEITPKSAPKNDEEHNIMIDEDDLGWDNQDENFGVDNEEKTQKEHSTDDIDDSKMPKTSQMKQKSSRFMYSDAIVMDEEKESRNTSKDKRDFPEKSKQMEQTKDEPARRHNLFGDDDFETNKPKSNLERYFIEEEEEVYGHKSGSFRFEDEELLDNDLGSRGNQEDIQSRFSNAKSISSSQLYRDSDSQPREKFSRFDNARSISSSDFNGDSRDRYSHSRDHDSSDDDEFDASDLVTKIAETAKADLKSIGESIVESGRRLAEWFNDFTGDY